MRLRGAAAAGLLLLTAASACNTLKPDAPVQECESDEDCPGPGERCFADAGFTCINPDAVPRRPVLGFEVVVSDFRIEFRACDAAISSSGFELTTPSQTTATSPVSITAHSERATVDCADCCLGPSCTPEPDECVDGMSLCIGPFQGRFSLRQPSRLGNGRFSYPEESYPLVDEMDMPVEGPLVFDWPRNVGSEADSGNLVMDIRPTNTSLAPFRRLVTPPVDGEVRNFDVLSRRECHRTVRGLVRRLGETSGIEGAKVEFIYDEAVALSENNLGMDTNPTTTCEVDADCDEGLACDLAQGRCALDLRGVVASRDTITDESGLFGAPVYSYCEHGEVESRDFVVEVTPPSGSGMPRVRYPVRQAFSRPFVNQPIPSDALSADVCLPAWASAVPIDLSYIGDPVRLRETAQGDYVCCRSDCLPTPTQDRPPSQASSCDEIELSVIAHTEFSGPDPAEYEADDCLVPQAVGSGEYEATSSCEAGICPLTLSPGDDSEARSYTMEIVSPRGSVFRSEVRTVELEAGATALPQIGLSPRVVLTGRIACDDSLGENCVPGDVMVVAERIRMPGDGLYTPSPYLFDTVSLEDGSYLLLLDPGVYVMTALPARNAPGGPAPYVVVDLRLVTSTSLVTVIDGVPIATAPTLELDPGVPSRLAMNGFEANGRLFPYDLGSWVYQSNALVDPDGRTLDLNDPTICYSDAGARGCQIRSMLRRGAGGIVPSISNRFDFTMRSSGPVSCGGEDMP